MNANDKWITIKSKSDEDNPRSKGYRRIKLGKGGKIVGGDVPKEVKGKKIGGKEFKEGLKKAGARQNKKPLSNTPKKSVKIKEIDPNQVLYFRSLNEVDINHIDLGNYNEKYINFSSIQWGSKYAHTVYYNGKKIDAEQMSRLKKDAQIKDLLNKEVFKKHPVLNKKKVEALLKEKMQKQGYHQYIDIKDAISCWASTSADHNVKSIAHQLVANQVFDLKAHIKHFHANVIALAEEELQKATKKYPTQAFIRNQYNATQEWFKKRGYKPTDTLILYRGVNLKGKGKNMKYTLQPLSSFSSNIDVAREFANGDTIFMAEVPINKILSHPQTGFGCTNECEFVVLGAKDIEVKKYNNFGDVLKHHASKDSLEFFDGDEYCIDEDLRNADWTKKTWDLPEIGSKEFYEFLKATGMTIEHFKQLPAYQLTKKNRQSKPIYKSLIERRK